MLANIEMSDDPKYWRYLGDGVYLTHDGFQYWLYANDHRYPTDRIALDCEVVSALTEIFKEGLNIG